MIREEFNKLDINSQVNYFNNELKNKDNNFNAICKQLGISKNTILNRFKKEGLLPARQGQKIIAFYDYPIEQNCSVEIKKLTAKNSEVKNIKAENSATKNFNSENSMMKNKKKASDPEDINSILKRIELLEQKVETLQSANLNLHKEVESEGIHSDKNFINSYEKTITKTFKIDVEVYQELEKLFDRYKMYKKQDIVSSLLKYALDNIE